MTFSHEFNVMEDGKIQCKIHTPIGWNCFGYGDTEEEARKDAIKQVENLSEELFNDVW